jgi:hypothetical protein
MLFHAMPPVLRHHHPPPAQRHQHAAASAVPMLSAHACGLRARVRLRAHVCLGVHVFCLYCCLYGACQVTREIPRNGHGYTWVITFIDVRIPTSEGLLRSGRHYLKAFVLDDPVDQVRTVRCQHQRNWLASLCCGDGAVGSTRCGWMLVCAE